VAEAPLKKASKKRAPERRPKRRPLLWIPAGKRDSRKRSGGER
jgi:hypothetical protein